MTNLRQPMADAAVDPDTVLSMLAEPVRLWRGLVPSSVEIEILKRTDRRLIARYELAHKGRTAAVVGKWYGTDRGELVAQALAELEAEGVSVPHVVAYVPQSRALFVEAIDGVLFRDALRRDQASASKAGAWLAAFHRSLFRSPRRCGPKKQVRAIGRWGAEQPELQDVGRRLEAALERCPDPGLPVHYDFYHSQLVLAGDRTVAFDLDEAGLGDPMFDLVHFDAHLRLLGLQWYGDPGEFGVAAEAFRAGYEKGGGPAVSGSASQLAAFAWFKLAYQGLRRGRPPEEWRYALDSAGEALVAT